MRLRRICVGLLACLSASALAAPAAAPAAPPPIKHVWVLLLENKNFQETFGNTSPAPYLSRTLTAQGELLANYYATTHLSLGNYISLISGQSSNPITQSDCQLFQDVFPGTPGADGQAIGQGCVYPSSIKTIADQLTARGLSWKGYMEDMGNSPTEPKTCRHPPVNSRDNTQSAKVGDQYAARHNPFVYFHSIIDNAPLCNANVVPLDRLPGDLGASSTTPNYSFITPNLCNDAHDEPCVDRRPGGLRTADEFLRAWVPRILASPAYREGGLLIVTFDEAEADPRRSDSDASSCCNQPAGPNTPNPGGPIVGSGGGLIGAVLLSPWVRPGTINATPYNHYALLRSVQELFGLGPLGYSGQAGLRAFGSDVYNGTGPDGTGPAVGPTSCAAGSLPMAQGGRYPRGSIIARTRIVRRSGRTPVLEVSFRRDAGFSALVRPRPARRTATRRRGARRAPAFTGLRRTSRVRRVGPRRVSGCRTYRAVLPYRHGSISLRASIGSAAELRSLRF